jgi:hypothetical protein
MSLINSTRIKIVGKTLLGQRSSAQKARRLQAFNPYQIIFLMSKSVLFPEPELPDFGQTDGQTDDSNQSSRL